MVITVFDDCCKTSTVVTFDGFEIEEVLHVGMFARWTKHVCHFASFPRLQGPHDVILGIGDKTRSGLSHQRFSLLRFGVAGKQTAQDWLPHTRWMADAVYCTASRTYQ
jgi:hypothetical protein